MKELLDKLGGALICCSKVCQHKRDCANHVTAGDFRAEDGNTPQVKKEGDDYYCEGQLSEFNGMLIVKEGKLTVWAGVYGDTQ